MTDLFTRRRDIAICPWTKQIHLSECSNRKLRASTFVNVRTVRSTAGFASALSNVNNVKISDLLEVFVMLLFSSLCFHLRIICRRLQVYENIHGGDSFLITEKNCGRSFFRFSPATLQKHTWVTVFQWNYLL